MPCISTLAWIFFFKNAEFQTVVWLQKQFVWRVYCRYLQQNYMEMIGSIRKSKMNVFVVSKRQEIVCISLYRLTYNQRHAIQILRTSNPSCSNPSCSKGSIMAVKMNRMRTTKYFFNKKTERNPKLFFYFEKLG